MHTNNLNKELVPSKEVFQYISGSLSNYSKSEAEGITYLLLEEISGFGKIDILLNRPISKIDYQKLNVVIARLNHKEPIQYILGKTEFYGRNYTVNKHVLIPRPETEELVNIILKENLGASGFKVLDICTGSGCIAITLKKELDAAAVDATDISRNALETARINASANDAEITFRLEDIIQQPQLSQGPYDLIVSNPPYVMLEEKATMDNNVLLYEPPLALFVPDENPLIFYRKISSLCLDGLKENGQLYFEINEKKGNDICAMLQEFGFRNIQLLKDLNNKDRFISCTKEL